MAEKSGFNRRQFFLGTYRTLVAQNLVFCVSALRELQNSVFLQKMDLTPAYTSFESWMRPADRIITSPSSDKAGKLVLGQK